jgi:hypothetical protein
MLGAAFAVSADFLKFPDSLRPPGHESDTEAGQFVVCLPSVIVDWPRNNRKTRP